MIDLHAHIIWGIDDGPKSYDDSIDMLNFAYSRGTRAIAATSHFYRELFEYEQEEYHKKLEQLKAYCASELPGLRLYSGNELFLMPDAVNALRFNTCNSYQDSDYVLVEISPISKLTTANELLEDIKTLNKKIIIAHVERIDNDDAMIWLKKWHDEGLGLQINAQSLIGTRYKSHYNNARKLLKQGYLHIVASDGHDLNKRKPDLSGAYGYLKTTLGEEGAALLLHHNPASVLQNGEIHSIRNKGLNSGHKRNRWLAKWKGDQ